MGGGKNVIIEPHRHPGVFVARGKEDALVTRNMVIGDSVYGEKRISVDVSTLFYEVLVVVASNHSKCYVLYIIFIRLKTELRLSTECGIPSGQSWLQQFWVELTKFICLQEAKYFIWELPPAPLSHMFLMSLDRLVFTT